MGAEALGVLSPGHLPWLSPAASQHTTPPVLCTRWCVCLQADLLHGMAASGHFPKAHTS